MRGLVASFAAGVLTLACGLQTPVSAQGNAQDWPARQITIVVPFGAGGSADLLARILATHMQPKFGQTVVGARALPCPDGLARLRVACEQDDAARLRRASQAVDDPLRNVTLLLVCLPLNLCDPAVLACDERPDPLDVARSNTRRRGSRPESGVRARASRYRPATIRSQSAR